MRVERCHKLVGVVIAGIDSLMEGRKRPCGNQEMAQFSFWRNCALCRDAVTVYPNYGF